MAVGTCAPIVCPMVNHAVMVGGRGKQMGRDGGIKQVHKAPLLFRGVAKSG